MQPEKVEARTVATVSNLEVVDELKLDSPTDSASQALFEDPRQRLLEATQRLNRMTTDLATVANQREHLRHRIAWQELRSQFLGWDYDEVADLKHEVDEFVAMTEYLGAELAA